MDRFTLKICAHVRHNAVPATCWEGGHYAWSGNPLKHLQVHSTGGYRGPRVPGTHYRHGLPLGYQLYRLSDGRVRLLSQGRNPRLLHSYHLRGVQYTNILWDWPEGADKELFQFLLFPCEDYLYVFKLVCRK